MPCREGQDDAAGPAGTAAGLAPNDWREEWYAPDTDVSDDTDSSFVQRIVDVGAVLGRQADVLAALQVRLGPVPETLEHEVRRVHQAALLSLLFCRAVETVSLSQFALPLARLSGRVAIAADPALEMGLGESVATCGRTRVEAGLALRMLRDRRDPLSLPDRILTRLDLLVQSPLFWSYVDTGICEARQTDVLLALELRWGKVPDATEQRLRESEDPAALARCLRWALEARDIREFTAALRETGSPGPTQDRT